jgi:hypothetical protein
MLAYTRQQRKIRQEKHIISPLAFSKEQNKYIENPENENNNGDIENEENDA